MAYFDLELNMLDGLAVDAGGVGSTNRLYLDKIVLNGDTTDMVVYCELDASGKLLNTNAGVYNSDTMRTTYTFSTSSTNPPWTQKPGAFLTTQPLSELNAFLNKTAGWDNTLVFKTFKFPDDLPINYQPQLDDHDTRITTIEGTPGGALWGGFNALDVNNLTLNGNTTAKVTVKLGNATITGTYNATTKVTTYPLNLGTDPFHYLETALTVTDKGTVFGKQYLAFTIPNDISLNYQPQIDVLGTRMDTAEENIEDLQEQINQIEQQAGVIDANDFEYADLRGSFGQLSLTKYALDYFYGTATTPATVNWGGTGTDTVQSFIGYNAAIPDNLALIVSLCDTAPTVGSYIASKPQKGVVKCTATDGSTATCVNVDMDDLYWQGTFTAPNFTGTGTIFEEINNGIKVTNLNDQSSWELNNILNVDTRKFNWAYTGNGQMASSDGDTLGLVKGTGDVGTHNGEMYYKPQHKQLVQRLYPVGNSYNIDVNGDTSGPTNLPKDTTVFAIFDYAGGSYNIATGSVMGTGDWTKYVIPRTDANGNALTQIALSTSTVHGYGNKYIWIWRPSDGIATTDIPGTVKSDTADMDGIKAFTVDDDGGVSITPYQSVADLDDANLDPFAFISENDYTSDIVKQSVGKINGLLNAVTDMQASLNVLIKQIHVNTGDNWATLEVILDGDTTNKVWIMAVFGTFQSPSTNIRPAPIAGTYYQEKNSTIYLYAMPATQFVKYLCLQNNSNFIVPVPDENIVREFGFFGVDQDIILASSEKLGLVRYGNEFQNDVNSVMELKPASVDWSKLTHLPPWNILGNITGSSTAPISAVGMTQLSSALADPAKNSIPLADRTWVSNQLMPFNQYKNAHPNPTSVVTQTTEDAIDKLTLVNNSNYSGIPLDRAVASMDLLLQLLGTAGNSTAIQKIVGGQAQTIPQLLWNTVVGSHPNDNSIYSATALYDQFQSIIQQFYNVALELAAIKGVGGYLQHHDFGTDTPTQISLNTYAANYIWGDGEWTTGDGSNPADVWTVTDGGATHVLVEVFNATRVKNDNNNNTWELANTPNTDPPIFEWINTGSDGVSIATEITAGLVRASQSSDISVDPSTGDMSLRAGIIDQSKLVSGFTVTAEQMPTYAPKTVLGNTSQQGQKPQAISYADLVEALSTYASGWNTNPLINQTQLQQQVTAINNAINAKTTTTVDTAEDPLSNLYLNNSYKNTSNSNKEVYSCNYINSLDFGGGAVNPYDGAFSSFTPDTAIFINGQQSAEIQVGSYFGTPLFARTLRFDFGGTPQQQTSYLLKTLTDADVIVKFEGCLYNTSSNSIHRTTTPIGNYPVYNSAENISMSLCKQPQGKINLYCLNTNLQNTAYSDWHGAITFYYTKTTPFSS